MLWYRRKRSQTSDYRQPLELKKARKHILSLSLYEEEPCQHLDFSPVRLVLDYWLQDCKRISGGFKLLSVWWLVSSSARKLIEALRSMTTLQSSLWSMWLCQWKPNVATHMTELDARCFLLPCSMWITVGCFKISPGKWRFHPFSPLQRVQARGYPAGFR